MARRWNFYTSKEIKPDGWLKRQLQIQAEGLSGNLDKVWKDVRYSAWLGGTALQVERREVGEIPFSSQQPPVIIKAEGKPIRWGLEDGYDTVCAKVPESGEVIGKKEELFLYPYGCAKLRMTELPLCAAEES